MSADRIFLARAARNVEESPAYQPISKIRMIAGEDGEGNQIVYTAGNDTGRTIEVENPWATQAMANNVLAAVHGYAYKPYSADGAILNPTAEIGDAVSVADVYSVLADIETTFSPLMSANIGAREDGSIDHEYPYESSAERQINRSIAETRTTLTVEMGRIATEVAVMNDPRADGSIVNRLTKVEQTVNGIHAYTDEEIKTISGGVVENWAEINFTPTKISSKVSSYFDAAGAADTAKSEAINTSKGYTDTQIAPIEGAYTSAIEQSAKEIKATVAAQETKWDLSELPSGVNITAFGYGIPINSTASRYTNQYYLDQSSGRYYRSNGTSWVLQTQQLKLITSNIQSAVEVNAGSIRSVVADVSAANNAISEIVQNVNSIQLSISNDYYGNASFSLGYLVDDDLGHQSYVQLDADTFEVHVNSANIYGTIYADAVRANAYIQSPNIYGGTIYGGTPYNPNGALVIGGDVGNYGDLTLYGGSSFHQVFKVYDELGTTTFLAQSGAIGGFDGTTFWAAPGTTWNFRNATVILPS